MQDALESMGLHKGDLHLLDTAETAQRKYDKATKEETPFGWDSFNQDTLFRAYEKRIAAVPYTAEDWAAQRDANPQHFYRSADAPMGLEVNEKGQAIVKDSPEAIATMQKELLDRERKKLEYSRKRKVDPHAPVEGINRRNDHFVKKLERFYGQHTAEIKANLERGTALPDR
jgi:pre-mRNA-splicing factor SYF2